MTLNAGDILHARYRIDGIIGKGGMGAVYQGEDTVLQVPVAIKENLNPLPQAVRQFKREALLLASLRHSNLPRVTDHFVEGDLQYLIMDYVPGDDLKAIIEQKGALPQELVLGYAREIVAAVSYLHHQHPSVVHRDIKPANIKITPEGKPVLVDFGIAKAAEAGSVTTTGARSLTPGFAPPEQYGSSPTDGRSDEYSLAATLYNLLTGAIPPDSLDRTLGHAELRPAREVNPAISLVVDRSLWKAMSLSPSERFTTIDDFGGALEGKVEIVETVPASSREPRTQVHRVLEATTQLKSEAPLPEPPTDRRLPWPAIGGLGALACIAVVVVGLVGYSILGGHAIPAAATATRNAVAGLPSTATVTPGSVLPAGNKPTLTIGPTDQPTATRTASPQPTPIGGGGLLAFTSNRGADKHYQIYTYDFNTKEIRQLTFDSADKGRTSWSPDGTQLYYEGKTANGTWDIFLMNSDGSKQTNLTNNDVDDVYPAAAPTGTLLAFVSRRNQTFAQTYLMAPDGSGLLNIASKLLNKPFNMPEEWDPAWSPDGRFLYLIFASAGPVRVYEWDTKNPANDPVIVTVTAGDYDEAEPAASPSGKYIAYTQNSNQGSEICIAETDLSKRHPCSQPLTDMRQNSDPEWSPDGMWLAFTSRRTGNNEVYIMTLTGASVTDISNDPNSQARYPAWQPRVKSG